MYDNAYINRGACHHILGDHSRAIADYKKALELNPETSFRKRLKKYLHYVDKIDKKSAKGITV